MNIKSRFSFITVLTIILSFVSLFFRTDSHIVEAEEEKTYIIATDTTYAPFEFVDGDGNLVGIDMDIIRAIAEDQGFDIEIQVLGFNAALQAVESGQADGIIAGMSVTEERDLTYDFSDPYYESTTNFAVKSDSDIQSLEDLRGETVAVKTGTTGALGAEALQDEYGYDIRTFEDSASMYEDVLSGNSVAAAEDYPVIQYAINTGALDLRVLDEPLDSSPNAFAVKDGENQELLDMFNQGLENIRANGTYEDIITSYLGDDAIAEAQTSSSTALGLVGDNIPELYNGLWTTVWMAFVSFIIAVILGLIIGLFSVSPSKVLNVLSDLYIDIFRSVPLIVLSFLVYFGIPQMMNITMANTAAGIISLSLNAAAYIAEIFRGGIEAVDPGQSEAGLSLGLSRGQTMRHIILPQAFKIMVPSFVNQFVITLKDTSILSVIGIVELTQTGRLIIARTYQSGVIWITVGIIYIVVIVLLTKLSQRMRKQINVQN